MLTGLLLDNLSEPQESTWTKVAAMRPGVVETLWTAGTKHRAPVYDRLRSLLGDELRCLIIRVDAETPVEWVTAAEHALSEVPADWQGRTVFGVRNEPNIEVEGRAEDYGRFYAQVCVLRPRWTVQKRLLFAGPSFGVEGAWRYLEDSLARVPYRPPGAINLYAHQVDQYIGELLPLFDGAYLTELNTLSEPRIEWLRGTFDALERKGVKAACLFIAGGVANGAWDERYIITEDEAAALRRPQTEANMASIAVALCPSNQDRNMSTHRPDYNEFGGMHWQAPLIAAACARLGINARVIVAKPESADPPGSLAGLREQLAAARKWLDQQPEVFKALVNLHTDSGDFSHTFGIYGRQVAASRDLADAIGMRVHRALETADYRSFSQLGNVDYSTYLFATTTPYPACLIEECAHTVRRDIDALYERPQQVAEAFAQGIAAYAGVVPQEDWRAKYEELAARVKQAVTILQ